MKGGNAERTESGKIEAIFRFCSWVSLKDYFIFNFYLLILERKGERDLLFHLFMHSLVDSFVCSD